jgi:hypothetical protein
MSDKLTDLMGVVLFGEPADSASQAQVAEALEAAGFPESLSQHLNPRSYFIRATRELAKSLPEVVLRDMCSDDEATVRFAFLARRMVLSQDGSGDSTPVYDAACEIAWNKKDDTLRVIKVPEGMDKAAVLAQAFELLDAAKDTWSPADLNSLVKRILKAKCKLVPLRPGVSFIAGQHTGLAEQIQKFYDALKVPYYRLEIGYSPALAKQFHVAIVADLRAEIGKIMAEIHMLTLAGDLTERKAKRRLLELRNSLREYRELAESSRFDLDEMLEQSGDAGQIIAQADQSLDLLMAAAQAGQTRIPDALVDLYLLTESDPEILAKLQTIRVAPPATIDIGEPTLEVGQNAVITRQEAVHMDLAKLEALGFPIPEG